MPKSPVSLQIGNTTFRRPWRIPEGLRVLEKFNSEYNFKEDRESGKYESQLIGAISETGVLESDGKNKEWKGGHGRKFLSFCQKFGFISPRPNNIWGKGLYDLNENGEDKFLIDFLNNSRTDIKIEKYPFSITPLGKMLADTNSNEYEITSEQKDIFLKSLYYQVQPSIVHQFGKAYDNETIRPLQFFIKILLRLIDENMEPTLSTGEISLIVNTAWTNNLSKIIDELKLFREKKKGKERKFAKSWFESKGGKNLYKIDFDTIWTYADPNISYLCSTGLIDKLGRKIILNKDKIETSKIISQEGKFKFTNNEDYLNEFWSGNLLPFEDEKFLTEKAISNTNILKEKFNYESLITQDKEFEKNKIKKIIYHSEDKIQEFEEIEFFKKQRHSTEEILDTLQKIGSDYITYNGIQFEPEPEHLEWIVWRAFLAINSFINEIKDTRGFKIDSNFLPTHHAPGGKEDLYFEFDEYSLIIEVTFKTGGSQFKDEVEPVYRHTAKRMNLLGDKPVYCLFIAPTIDLNLSNSFQRKYYDSKNEEYSGNIVPISIEQFSKMFLKLFHEKKILTPILFKEIFDIILEKKIEKEPKEWQTFINTTIEHKLSV